MKRTDIDRELSSLTLEQGVHLGILCVKEICFEKDWNRWSNHWLRSAFWRALESFFSCGDEIRGYGAGEDDKIKKKIKNLAAKEIIEAASLDDAVRWAERSIGMFDLIGTVGPQNDIRKAAIERSREARKNIITGISLAMNEKKIDLVKLKQKV